MEALLEQLCVEGGWCLAAEDRVALAASVDLAREEIIDCILRLEFGDVEAVDAGPLEWVSQRVDDWLYDPSGRGARSGLPL
jgi:hypothetical protein